MAKKYETIVVGAGLGGLSAATLLAKRGHRVLLLERHNVPGGYATSFVRGRYEFEISLHALSDIGPKDKRGVLWNYLNYLGVAKHLDFVEVSTMYRSVFPDVDIELPASREGFEETLCSQFPHDAKGIRRFLDRIVRLSEELSLLTKLQRASFPGVLTDVAALPFKLRALPRYFFASWADVLNRDVSDPRARSVLSQTWGYFGLPPSKVSFFYFGLGLASFLRFGVHHVKGRSQAISNAFVRTFEEYGGELRTSCGVSRILTRGDRVRGVITDAGEEIEADSVVSNADPVTVCRDLIGLEHVPTSYVRKLHAQRTASATCCVYLGVAKPLDYFGINAHEIFVNEDHDMDNHFEKSKTFAPPGVVVVACYNAVLPEISPPGTSIVTLTAMAQPDSWRKLPPEQYFERKMAVADGTMKLAEQVLPGIRDHVEVIEASTPLTNMRYAGTLGGSIYGFHNTPFSHTLLRPGNKGPLGGLYFVGAWVQPGGGYGPCMFSGQIAGEMIHMGSKARQGRKS